VTTGESGSYCVTSRIRSTSSSVTRRVRGGGDCGLETCDIGLFGSQRHSFTARVQMAESRFHSRSTVAGETSLSRRSRQSAKCSGPRSESKT